MIVTERIAKKFDAMFAAEEAVKREKAIAEAGIDADTRFRARQNYNTAKATLNTLFSELNAEEIAEYGVYRMSLIKGDN